MASSSTKSRAPKEKCPTCGARLKAENLAAHLERVHPQEARKPSLLMYSNSPWANSAYGIQTRHLLYRLQNRGYRVGCATNWGMMGSPISFDGYEVYGQGGGLSEVETFEYYTREKYDVLISLYDLWVLNNFPDLIARHRAVFVPWLPIDMDGLSPLLGPKLEAATWIAPLTQYGEGLVRRAGYSNVTRIPHGLDMAFWRPFLGEVRKDTARPEDLANLGDEWGRGRWTKEELKRALGFEEDCVLVGMVQMNKGVRKLLPHQLEGVKLFMERNPDLRVRLYMHTAIKGTEEGFDLAELLRTMKFTDREARVPCQYAYWVGYDESQMRAVYNACDVTILASIGEGFACPVVESLACGVPAVAGDYAATRELLEPTPELRVKAAANWWAPHPARFWIPDVDDIAAKLELALKRDPEKDREVLHAWAAERYDWSLVVKSWEDVIAKAMAEADRKCLRAPPLPEEWKAMAAAKVVEVA